VVTEVHEDGDDEDDDERIDDEADSTEADLQRRFARMTFVVSTRGLEQLPQWVKVSEVFKTDEDAPFLVRAGIEKISDPRYTRYSQRLARLRAIRKYVYRMDILERALSYDEVTEIFVRVNSLGAKLRGSDLALAQITAKWRGALRTFQEFQRQCTSAGFELDLGILLKNLIAFATGQSRFLTVSSLSVETLQRSWASSMAGMDFALNFLRSNVGIDSPALLSSPFLIITLGYYGHARQCSLSADEALRLRHWALLANAKGRYSRGSSETFLDQDLGEIRRGSGPTELLERLRLQVGRLDVIPEDLEGRNQRSALFKTMFLAFRESGARDWQSNLNIALHHKGAQHRLQFHHVFPKALLKTRFPVREADDIANLAFIGGQTNRSISDKAPAHYIPTVMARSGAQAFEAQCIPTDPSLLAPESYKVFLAARRQRISERLNEFLGMSGASGPTMTI